MLFLPPPLLTLGILLVTTSTSLPAAERVNASKDQGMKEVSLSLDYVCGLPVIEDQPITLDITTSLPRELSKGMNPALEMTAIQAIPRDVQFFMSLFRVAKIEGQARILATLELPYREQPWELELPVPTIALPSSRGAFDILAEGALPPVNLEYTDLGKALIRVGDLLLDLKTLRANGDPVAAPVGEFSAHCRQLPGQDNVLHRFTVTDAPAPNNDPAIHVMPESLDFGSVQSGGYIFKTLTISNTGGTDLGINNFALENARSDFIGFTVAPSSNCSVLAVGESCNVVVAYYPREDQEQSVNLVIDSGDPEKPQVTIPVTGTSVQQLPMEETLTLPEEAQPLPEFEEE
ncbi:MAG: choice-of-anchor D domain-containing protein [Halomonadaceae bacterium]|nr:MAG: choice-of-anchor D domain-containing protein [Halomonadaceae bacterium]